MCIHVIKTKAFASALPLYLSYLNDLSVSSMQYSNCRNKLPDNGRKPVTPTVLILKIRNSMYCSQRMVSRVTHRLAPPDGSLLYGSRKILFCSMHLLFVNCKISTIKSKCQYLLYNCFDFIFVYKSYAWCFSIMTLISAQINNIYTQKYSQSIISAMVVRLPYIENPLK